MLAILIFLAHSISTSAIRRKLETSSSFNPIRITYIPLSGYFKESQEAELKTRILPSGVEFFSSALQVNPLTSSLKPSSPRCEDMIIPSENLEESFDSDLIIYLHTNTSISWPMFGKFCERESGDFKRPIIGHIGVNNKTFFNLYENLKIQYLIRETCHVLALDFELFHDFVHFDGRPYSPSQYSIRMNYVNREKTVRGIAFPAMLAKARESFDCALEGLEFEDFFEFEGKFRNTFFWDARIMPQDILSSVMSNDVIFSDITLALFEDSGWYKVNYDFASRIKVGWKAGCKWHQEKCIVLENLNLDGFCDQKTPNNQCDPLALGYGECFITQHDAIPPHESYFNNPKLGGKEAYDYCPTILVPEINRCRDSTSSPNQELGEIRGISSRCFKSSLSKSPVGITPQGACYKVDSCNEKFIKITLTSTSIDCPYGSKVSVPGFSGQIICPDSFEFCHSLPCLNLCSGKGRCHEGKCYCNPTWGGDDCSFKCPEHCSSCKTTGECLICSNGFYLDSHIDCKPCERECFTCGPLPNICKSCPKGKELINSKCVDACLENCAACDSPCSKCDSGYFLENGICIACDLNCKECDRNQKNCTACKDGLVVVRGQCKPMCADGCSKCENPCSSCKIEYLLKDGECLPCDNVCKECQESTSFCTKCFTGYLLKENTCVQGCMENCLSCDDPCTVCEDGYFQSKGKCVPCSEKCLTCSNSEETCIACKSGYVLQGAECLKKCLDNCDSCGYPCQKCSNGYYNELGYCERCSSNCKTCESTSTKCTSCFEGFGLIQGSCRMNCADHCFSCDSPCSICDSGFYIDNGSCLTCDKACSSCNGMGPDQCITCAIGYQKSKNICKLHCSVNCLTCDEPCTICAKGYYSFEMGCSKCPFSCTACKSESMCTECFLGFGLVENTCKRDCAPHCLSCTSPCSECEKGYYLFNGTCLQCEATCLTCSDFSHSCTSCPSGYTLSENHCKIDCIANCITCQYPCLACASNYVSVSGICQKCPEGCRLCNQDLTECYACEIGFIYSNGGCSKICPNHCSSCDFPCTKCDSGFLSVQGECTPCIIPCRSCVSSLDTCTSCITDYILQGSSCKSRCGEKCLSCDYPCSICQEGFVSIQGVCKACSEECRTCQGNQEFCISCQFGKKLENGKCQKICVENCDDCSFPCKRCKAGFESDDGGEMCKICINYLEKDQVFAEFLKDFSGISIVFSFPVLELENECEKYFKVFTLVMLGRLALCNWVNSQKLVVVFGASPDLHIQSLEMFPITVLGNDCSKPKSDLSIKILTTRITSPFTSISAPEKFTIGCSNEVLVIQCFTNEPTFQISLSTIPKSPLDSEYIDYLHGKILVIPEYKLSESILTVTLNSTNFFEKSSSSSKSIKIQKSQNILSYIDAGSQIRIKTSESLTIRGMINENSCVDPSHLTMSWSYIEYNEKPFKHGEEIVSKSRVPNILIIPKGNLPAGRSYVFRFTVKSKENNGLEDQLSSNEIIVDVVQEPLLVQLDRSDSSHPINDELNILASVKNEALEMNKRFEWKCLENNKDCLGLEGQLLIQDEAQRELVVKPYRMKPGSSYLFSVKVSSGELIGFQSVMITATNAPGIIKIPNLVSPQSVGEKFEVFPEYQVKNDILLKWTQTLGPAVKTSSNFDSPYLIINKNEMVSGRMYEFMVSSGSNDSMIFSKVSWVTNTGPKCAGFASLVHGNSVTLSIECEDRDLQDDILTYIYGVKHDSSYFPLRVIHSPSTTFKLRGGSWTVFITVCDSLNTCIRKENQVKIPENSQEISYKTQRLFPENLPTAILNSAEHFNKDNFLHALNYLQHYILSQELDLVHLKMSIECLEILTRSNKTHFMKNNQKEIVEFLTRVASGIRRIDSDTMKYVIELFSEHEITQFELVSKLFKEFSFKWAGKMPPGESLTIKSAIIVKRARFLGSDIQSTFSFGNLNISNLVLNVKNHMIYDLLFIIYPGSPFPTVEISYFEVGFYHGFNLKLLDSPIKLSGDLTEPFFIHYSNMTKGDFICLQLRGNSWIDEGCNFEIFNRTTARLTSWHLSMYSIVDSDEIRIGYSAIITESVILVLSIFLVALFCMVDRSKSPLAHSEYQVLSTQRDQEEFEIVEGEKVPVEKKRASLDELRHEVTPNLVYHPIFNVYKSQPGDRRAASVLHFSAIVLSEFVIIGGMFNPDINKVFDDDGNFLKFSSGQVIFLCIGMVATQLLSACLMYLNSVHDQGATKRLLGMGLSTLAILITSCTSMILSISYPSNYSLYWVICFCCFLVVEIVIFETLLWVVNLKVNKKENAHDLSRNVRVFTSES